MKFESIKSDKFQAFEQSQIVNTESVVGGIMYGTVSSLRGKDHYDADAKMLYDETGTIPLRRFYF